MTVPRAFTHPKNTLNYSLFFSPIFHLHSASIFSHFLITLFCSFFVIILSFYFLSLTHCNPFVQLTKRAAEGSSGGEACVRVRERLLQLESIFALGISITGPQSSASLIMDRHMALLTHAVLRLSLCPHPFLFFIYRLP